jgi:ferredoxin
MAYIVAEPCVKCKYTDCVEVCPVACFYEGENALVIHPDECIDCGACESECPTTAIFEQDDLPEKWNAWITINSVLSGASEPGGADTEGWPQTLIDAAGGSEFTVWPKIEDKKDALADADDYARVEDKIGDLSPKPGGA